MDRNATVHGERDKVLLAVIRLPAKVPVTDPRYGGAVVVNPGTMCFKDDSSFSNVFPKAVPEYLV